MSHILLSNYYGVLILLTSFLLTLLLACLVDALPEVSALF